jgi:pimeloyl-ACP methyl ester carboxylesterase
MNIDAPESASDQLDALAASIAPPPVVMRAPARTRGEAIGLAVIQRAFAVLGPVFPGAMGRFAARLFTRPRRHTPPVFEQEIALSAEKLQIDFAGMPLHAWSWGQGPVILLVHGWEGRGAQLARFMGPLVNDGYRVVALDGPAHGASPGKYVEVSTMANALLAVEAALGPLHGVIAHSFGGASTIVALTRGLRAGRVVIIGAPDALMSVIGRFKQVLGLSGAAEEAFLEAFGQQLGARPETFDVAKMSATLPAQALIVHDRGDTEVGFNEGYRVHQGWPGSVMLATEGLGHRRILKTQSVIEAAHRFLTAPV